MKLRLFLSLLAALILFPVSLSAQYQDCSSCDPYYSMASDGCQYCADVIFHIDYCETYGYSTCGERMGAGLRDGCYPNWQEISREVQGTYGEGYYLFCLHHKVEWVTQEDSNHCNINSYFWYHHYCHDNQDGAKWFDSCGGNNCCNEQNPGDCSYDPNFSCNHYHSCTG